MGEFTGDYNRCSDCGHIYDFNDMCPDCGSENINELNANEVRDWVKGAVESEAYRLEKMLQSHGD